MERWSREAETRFLVESSSGAPSIRALHVFSHFAEVLMAVVNELGLLAIITFSIICLDIRQFTANPSDYQVLFVVLRWSRLRLMLRR
jgi:hypothetical protein